MNVQPIRHGDVVLVPVNNKPPKGRRAKRVTLAVGENSGHAHVVTAIEWSEGDDRFVFSRAGADVVVAPPSMEWRHDPLPLPPGQAYRVVIEREYAPEAIRQVSD